MYLTALWTLSACWCSYSLSRAFVAFLLPTDDLLDKLLKVFYSNILMSFWQDSIVLPFMISLGFSTLAMIEDTLSSICDNEESLFKIICYLLSFFRDFCESLEQLFSSIDS